MNEIPTVNNLISNSTENILLSYCKHQQRLFNQSVLHLDTEVTLFAPQLQQVHFSILVYSSKTLFCNYPTEEGSLRFLKLAAGHIHHPPYTEQGFSLIKKEKLVSIPQFQQGFSKRKNPDKNVSFIIVTDSAYLGLLTCKNLLILVL